MLTFNFLKVFQCFKALTRVLPHLSNYQRLDRSASKCTPNSNPNSINMGTTAGFVKSSAQKKGIGRREEKEIVFLVERVHVRRVYRNPQGSFKGILSIDTGFRNHRKTA
jgi:hypothetical protein